MRYVFDFSLTFLHFAVCIFVSDCHARVDIIACHCKTFRDEGRTLNLKHNSFFNREVL